MIYSIQDTTLTAIGDALRSKLGETRPVKKEYEVFNYGINSFDEDVVSGEAETGVLLRRYFIYPDNTAYIIVKCKYYTNSGASTIEIGKDLGASKYYYGTNITEEIRIEGNQAFIQLYRTNAWAYAGCYGEVRGYDADGNLVLYPSKTETEFNGYKPEDMAEVIGELGVIPEKAFVITGDCSYRFNNNNWNWFIKNFGDRITTQKITNVEKMFYNSDLISNIPFEINCASSNIKLSYVFDNCKLLESLPIINSAKPSEFSYVFDNCRLLKEIPDNYFENWDFSYIDKLTSSYDGRTNQIFTGCYSLRSLPMALIEHGNPVAATSYCIYNNLAYQCHALDEIVDLPNPHKNATWNSNAINNMVDSTSRLKNLTFKNDIGSVNWKSQTLNCSNNTGWCSYAPNITSYSGIGEDKEVKDDATYQALKNDPDWFTCDIKYSRYNHDSAVATINSLPDTSAYLATAGGTNTIKFKGEAGSLTDGGAINTLTEEEIAVATAKGWTVSIS